MNKLMLFTAIFLVIGGYIIAQNMGTDFDDKGEKTSFVKEFAKWVWDVGKKTKNVVGYVIKEDWLPERNQPDINGTNSTG